MVFRATAAPRLLWRRLLEGFDQRAVLAGGFSFAIAFKRNLFASRHEQFVFIMINQNIGFSKLIDIPDNDLSEKFFVLIINDIFF